MKKAEMLNAGTTAERTGPIAVLFALVLALFVSSPALAGPGKKAYDEFVKQGALYGDERWQDYVQAVGDRLLKASNIKGEYNFYVLDDSSVNAFALPDGYIFIHRGLLAYLRSEDELAGVIGHEIGHVVGRHAKRSNRFSRLGNVAGFVAAVFTGSGAVQDLANTATATATSGYRREYELEADEYGGEFLARAGYSPLAMIDVIQVLKDHELFSRQFSGQPRQYHGLFASHPKNDKRLHDAVLKNQHLFPDELADAEGDFWELMNGLTFGDESAAGLVKEHTYYHSVLRVVVDFPESWELRNNGTEIMSTAPGGSDEALITLQRQGASDAKTPEDYLKKTLKRDDVTDGEALEVNGYDAYSADAPTAGSDSKLRLIAVINKDGDNYLLKGEAGTKGEEEALRKAFRATLESFRSMTAADARVANGRSLTVKMAVPGETYKDLARTSSLARNAENVLRVINGDHPYGEPTAGDYLKIIQ